MFPPTDDEMKTWLCANPWRVAFYALAVFTAGRWFGLLLIYWSRS